MSYVRVLVLPIFRRHWLFHTHVVSQNASTATQPNVDWRKGVGLEEKLQLLGESLKHRATARVFKAWDDLENAKEGSIQNRIYRFAQGVLSREDPQEVSLRNLPSDLDVERMEIFYPNDISEKLVRRRLRLMVKGRMRKHKLSTAGWSIGLFPLVPLLATPIPNLPLYYAGYRVYSNYSAWVGSSTLNQGLTRLDALGMLKLRTEIEQWRQEGVVFPPSSWEQRVLQEDKRYLDLLEQASMKWVPNTSPWEIKFIPSDVLQKHVCMKQRQKAPLDDDAAIELGHHFASPDLMKNVARARRRAIGAMFPTSIH